MVFSYYGSKSKIIRHYPEPEHRTIVEPFAGSARYSCLYGRYRDVWINDLYRPVYEIWKWIQGATLQDVEGLPELERGDDLRDIKSLSRAERYLLGFAVNVGDSSPRNIVTEWAVPEIPRLKHRLRFLVGKIDHWKITCLDFTKCRNPKEATYFVDPPYQEMGHKYVIRPKGYRKLRAYCSHRSGQVIVCENVDASWWDFDPLVRTEGQRQYSSVEGIKVLHND